MFLGVGFTAHCWKGQEVAANPQGMEDARCALIGNSFHAGVVALILAPLLVEYGILETLPSPQDIVNRAQLRPGDMWRPGWLASAQTEPFHRHDSRKRGLLHPNADAAKSASISDEQGKKAAEAVSLFVESLGLQRL